MKMKQVTLALREKTQQIKKAMDWTITIKTILHNIVKTTLKHRLNHKLT